MAEGSCYQLLAIFFICHPLHVILIHYENCDRNSRLVMDKENNGKYRLEHLNINESGVSMMSFHHPKMYIIAIFLTARLAALEVADPALLNQCYHPPIGVGRMI